MDSAPSSLSFVTRDGSRAVAGSVDEDGALLVSAGLAKDAALLFQAGKFMDCLRILFQLSQKKEKDPKVHHNIVIAENLQDGCSDPRRLTETLENILRQSKELAHMPGQQLEITSIDGRNLMVGMTGPNSDVFSSVSVLYNDEFGTSIAMFNLAVVWFHLQEFAKSFSYLDTLYQNIEPIDEGTALRICLLLLDVALLFHHASRSADVICYIEKAFCVNNLISQVENVTSAQQQSSLVSKSTSLPSKSAAHSDSVAGSTLENTLTRTLSEEALEDESLQLLSSLDINGQNLQRLSGIASSHDDLSRSQSEDFVADLRFKLHLYKVRFFLLTRNFKAAKREVKMGMNLARGKDYPLALYLKSQLEYARRNHHKAIKLLMASSSLLEMGISSMYYNNLGCIYYQLGKYHTSGVFFCKALKSCSFFRKEKPLKLLTLSQDKSRVISYNCGMHSLACGRPFHAARCFQNASLVFRNRPVLWLRIAECCLMALEKGLIRSDSSDVRVAVIGKGKWRHLALSRHREYVDSAVSDGEQLELSLSLARQCLINALYLLDAKYSGVGLPPEKELGEIVIPTTNHTKEPNASCQSISNGDVKEQKSPNNLQNCVIDFEIICMKEKHMMKQVVFADLAYVELALGNPSEALSAAKSLLKLAECSRIYLFLGIIYAAEALCLLNQPKEAAEWLMKYANAELPYSLDDCEKWKVVESGQRVSSTFCSPEEARGVFLANYAAHLALLGDYVQAQQFLVKALSVLPKSPQAILTAIYLDLKCGKTQEAIEKLKQHGAFGKVF